MKTDARFSRLRVRSLVTLPAVLDAIGVPVIITDDQGRIRRVNRRFTAETGYSAAEVHGRRPSLLSAGKTDPAIYTAMWDRLTRGLVWEGRLLDRRKDGSEFWSDHVIAPIAVSGQEDGVTAGYLAIIRDRQPLIALQDIASHLTEERRIIEGLSSLIYWKLDIDGKFAAVGGATESVLGHHASEITGRSLSEFLSESEAASAQEEYRYHVLSERPWCSRWRSMRAKDGSWRHFVESAEPWRAPSGELAGFYGISVDMTEQRRLSEEGRRIKAALDAVDIGVSVKDSAGNLLFQNRQARQFQSPPSLPVSGVEAGAAGAVPDQKVRRLTKSMACSRDGAVLATSEWPIGNGEVVTFDEDISELELIRSVYHEEIGTRWALFHLISSPVFVTDAKGMIKDCNTAFSAVIGAEAGDWLGRGIWDALPAADGLAELRQRIEEGDSAAVTAKDIEYAEASGLRRRFTCKLEPIPDSASGATIAYAGIMTDITAVRRAQEAAEAADRAKTAFLAAMSHELLTPIAGVLGSLELTRDQKLSVDQQDLYYKKAEEAALRLGNVFRRVQLYMKYTSGISSTLPNQVA